MSNQDRTDGPSSLAVLTSGSTIEDREELLAQGADDLAGSRSTVLGGRNILVIAAGALMTTGLTAIVLAWVGAAHSTILQEQVPYLISGGLLGLALTIIGAIAYFAHWLTILVREAREHEAARIKHHEELLSRHDDLITALLSLRPLPDGEEANNGIARGAQRERPIRRAPGGS